MGASPISTYEPPSATAAADGGGPDAHSVLASNSDTIRERSETCLDLGLALGQDLGAVEVQLVERRSPTPKVEGSNPSCRAKNSENGHNLGIQVSINWPKGGHIMNVLLLDPSWRIDRVIGVERACELLVAGHAVAASADIATVMRSPSIEVVIPTVVARIGVVRYAFHRPPTCTARRVRLRDAHVCQFIVDGRPCSHRGDSADHLVPSCRGGRSTWHNLVAACREHNGYKRDRSLDEMHRLHGWTLRRQPGVPTRQSLLLADIRHVQPGWELYLQP